MNSKYELNCLIIFVIFQKKKKIQNELKILTQKNTSKSSPNKCKSMGIRIGFNVCSNCQINITKLV